jgi:hypothetical protein
MKKWKDVLGINYPCDRRYVMGEVELKLVGGIVLLVIPHTITVPATVCGIDYEEAHITLKALASGKNYRIYVHKNNPDPDEEDDATIDWRIELLRPEVGFYEDQYGVPYLFRYIPNRQNKRSLHPKNSSLQPMTALIESSARYSSNNRILHLGYILTDTQQDRTLKQGIEKFEKDKSALAIRLNRHFVLARHVTLPEGFVLYYQDAPVMSLLQSPRSGRLVVEDLAAPFQQEIYEAFGDEL